MIVQVTAQANELRELRKDLNSLGTDRIPRALTRALNRAAQRTRTAILREAGAELGVARKRLVRRVRFQRRDEATRERLRGQVFIVVSDLPVAYLGKPRPTRTGARVRGRLYTRAFVATMPSGHTGVYRRPNAGHGTMTPKRYAAILARTGKAEAKPFRYPLREIKETVRHQMKNVSDEMVQRVGEPEFRKRFYHEVERAFRERR